MLLYKRLEMPRKRQIMSAFQKFSGGKNHGKPLSAVTQYAQITQDELL